MAVASEDTESMWSDRSLFSMVVDSAVSKPDRHEQVFARVPVRDELLDALDLLKRQFGRVQWQGLDEHQQLAKLEHIQEQLSQVDSPAGKLAHHAMHWGLQNRKHRRKHIVREPAYDADDPDLDKFMGG